MTVLDRAPATASRTYPLSVATRKPYLDGSHRTVRHPKRSLTGDSTEREDTRVLQVLYSFERGTLPIYMGQQMNLFVQAPPGSVPAHVAARGGEIGAAQ